MKGNKGITLVALIITIIVLLILAVVTISAVNEGSLFAHSNNAATTYSQRAEEENKQIQDLLSKIPKKPEKNNEKLVYDKFYAGSFTINEEGTEIPVNAKFGFLKDYPICIAIANGVIDYTAYQYNDETGKIESPILSATVLENEENSIEGIINFSEDIQSEFIISLTDENCELETPTKEEAFGGMFYNGIYEYQDDYIYLGLHPNGSGYDLVYIKLKSSKDSDRIRWGVPENKEAFLEKIREWYLIEVISETQISVNGIQYNLINLN